LSTKSQEERMRSILRRRFIEDVIQGEVRIWEKKDGVMTVRLMTVDDLTADPNEWAWQDSGLDSSF